MTQHWNEQTALQLGAGIADGSIDPVALTDFFLDRIAEIDTDQAIFVRTTADRARAEAMAAEARQRQGLRLGPLDGVPISWKDLVDSAGVATEAGTRLLAGRTPAEDALILARSQRAGLICLGKTNLPDFAFSGLGINPAFGTPANACDDRTARVPGGSSAGAAVSVAKGLAAIGIGSDTGGSVRIPAALNGLFGLKTTAGLVPLDGVVPLSPTLDTIGPLTHDAADANAMLAVLTGQPAFDLDGASLRGVRLLKPTNIFWRFVDDAVGQSFEAALTRLSRAGVEISEAEIPELDQLVALLERHGNMIASEGYAIWGATIEADPNRIYPPIRERFRAGRGHSAADAEALHLGVTELRASYAARVAGFHGVIAPTVPILAPEIGPLEADAAKHDEAAMKVAWNTRWGNLLGICAVTLPCTPVDGQGVGLMVMAPPFTEGALLRLSTAMEGPAAHR
jgi:aspartyl-tRNA(Asn)/glutamyl-tRNA(Gln) amidotransferase subunit A